MSFKLKICLLILVVVYNSNCIEQTSTTKDSKDETELEKAQRFSKVWEESSNLFYKLAATVMKKAEFKDCTMVLIYDDDINRLNHLSSETELIIQQFSRLRPIIYITWDKMRRVIRERFAGSPHQFKFSEKCYIVFGEFIQDLKIARLIKGIYKVFLPTAKFIFRSIPHFNHEWPTHPIILEPLHAQYSWDILEAVLVYNKRNQMRLLLYSSNPNLYHLDSRSSTKTRQPIFHHVLTAGMGSDGNLMEYHSSLFPVHTKDFLKAPYHLVYHPSSLASVADQDSTISTEANHAFQFIRLVAKDLNMAVDERHIKYTYEIGSKSGDGYWNGYIGQLMAFPNSIGLAFTHNIKYNDDIRVSHPYSTFSIGMIYMDATVSENMSVWVAVSQLVSVTTFIKVTTCIFSIGAILCIIELAQKCLFPDLVQNNRQKRGWDKLTWLRKWMDYSWLPVKIWFQQSFKLRHIRLRTALLFIGVWWFSAIYYSIFIKTFLISTMTHAPKSKLITSLEDLMNKEDWSWGTFLKPSVWRDLIGNSSYNELTEEMEYFDSHASCIEKVSDSKFVCIGAANILKAFMAGAAEENSHLVYVDTELIPSYLTLAFQKHSPFADIIIKKLQYIVEGELYGSITSVSSKTRMEMKIRHDKKAPITKQMEEEYENRKPALTIKGEDVDLSFKEQLMDSFEELFEDAEMEDIFSFVFLGFLISLLVFVIEHTYFSLCNSRNLNRDNRVIRLLNRGL